MSLYCDVEGADGSSRCWQANSNCRSRSSVRIASVEAPCKYTHIGLRNSHYFGCLLSSPSSWPLSAISHGIRDYAKQRGSERKIKKKNGDRPSQYSFLFHFVLSAVVTLYFVRIKERAFHFLLLIVLQLSTSTHIRLKIVVFVKSKNESDMQRQVIWTVMRNGFHQYECFRFCSLSWH